MKIFDINNKQHVRILKEEIQRFKYILKEAKQYSADEIWAKMSPEDRKTVLYAAKESNPNKYIKNHFRLILRNHLQSLVAATAPKNFEIALRVVRISICQRIYFRKVLVGIKLFNKWVIFC